MRIHVRISLSQILTNTRRNYKTRTANVVIKNKRWQTCVEKMSPSVTVATI
jgi:hypothetical protein